MVPVGESDGDFLIVLTSIRVLGIMNDKLTPETIWILAAIVTVVPVRAGLVDGEVVGHARAGRDGALRNAHGPVHVIRAILEETMEVHACALIAELGRCQHGRLSTER